MQKITSRSLRPGDIFISFVVLALLLLYTYGLLVIAPYPGFYLNPSNGEVLDVYQPQSDKIKEGDIVERVGSISLDDFHNDKTLNFFEGVQPGQTVEIAIQRDGAFHGFLADAAEIQLYLAGRCGGCRFFGGGFE